MTDIFSAELTDALTFRNIANYQHLKNSAPFDGDGYPDDHRPPSAQGGTLIGGDEISPGGFPKYNYYTDARQYSIEPQIQGNLGEDALNFTVGAYYQMLSRQVRSLLARLIRQEEVKVQTAKRFMRRERYRSAVSLTVLMDYG